MPYDTAPFIQVAQALGSQISDAIEEIRRLEAVETAQADEITGLSHEIDAARGEIAEQARQIAGLNHEVAVLTDLLTDCEGQS